MVLKRKSTQLVLHVHVIWMSVHVWAHVCVQVHTCEYVHRATEAISVSASSSLLHLWKEELSSLQELAKSS